MTLEWKHGHVNPIADDPAAASAGETLPSHWNASLTIGNDGAIPASSSDPGISGTFALGNDGALYFCYNTNMWVKFTGTTSF